VDDIGVAEVDDRVAVGVRVTEVEYVDRLSVQMEANGILERNLWEALLGVRLLMNIDEGDELVCLFNFSGETQSLQVSDLHRPFSGLKSLHDVLHEGMVTLSEENAFELEPYGCHWLRMD